MNNIVLVVTAALSSVSSMLCGYHEFMHVRDAAVGEIYPVVMKMEIYTTLTQWLLQWFFL